MTAPTAETVIHQVSRAGTGARGEAGDPRAGGPRSLRPFPFQRLRLPQSATPGVQPPPPIPPTPSPRATGQWGGGDAIRPLLERGRAMPGGRGRLLSELLEELVLVGEPGAGGGGGHPRRAGGRTASPGLAPRRCHPGQLTFRVPKSLARSLAGEEGAQGRGARSGPEGGAGLRRRLRASLASSASGRCLRPLSSPSPRMSGAESSEEKSRPGEGGAAARGRVAKHSAAGRRSRGARPQPEAAVAGAAGTRRSTGPRAGDAVAAER